MWLEIVIVIAALHQLPATNPAQNEMNYDWDFSHGHDVTVVAWPKERRPKPDSLYLLTLEREVRVKITPEKEFRRFVRRATFSRWGNQLDFVEFHLPRQSVDQIITTATELATQWNIDTRKLSAWKAEVDAGSENATVLLSKPSTTPAFAVEVFPTFDPNKPFRIVFTISWLNEPKAKSAATTEPSK